MVSPLKAHLSDDNSRIQPAIERIEKMSGSASIKNIAQFQGISVRHLESRIKNQTGLTPKLLSRTIRLQNILKHLFSGIPDTLTHLAFSNGYADQPHFNKDFKALTGRLPTFFMQPDRDDATLTYIRDMHEKHNGIHIFHQL
jgi:AraC-like DNA-binding protein